MTETEHTPGPWIMPSNAYTLANVGSDDGPNFSGGDWDITPPLGEAGPVAIASTRANARLIAAAPELLAALEKLTNLAEVAARFRDCSFTDGKIAITNARAAIAKAKGES